MPSFALITEGITDQVVLDNILGGFYGDDESIDIKAIQPARDATDDARQEGFGGFEKVLEYCSLPRLSEVFLYNDFLIIQLDTDIASHPSINISIENDGVAKSPHELIDEFKRLIASRIGDKVYNRYAERIILAISIHSIECWILPLHLKSKTAQTKRVNCEAALKRAVERANLRYIKDYQHYQAFSKDLLKRKKLDECISVNESLSIFIESLPLNNSPLD